MKVIIQKREVPSNSWHYPTNPKDFPNGVPHPTLARSLVCDNESGKTLTELNDGFDYVIVEFTGELPSIIEDLPIKRTSMSDILITLPNGTMQELREVIKTGFGNGSPTNEEIEAAKDADVILAYLMVGKDINVNAPKFIEMTNFMINHLNISVTQAHIDTLRNDILEERRDL